MQRFLADIEKVRECEQLVIKNGLNAILDFGNRAAADLQPLKLKLRRELLLRPAAQKALPSHLRANDVPLSHPDFA